MSEYWCDRLGGLIFVLTVVFFFFSPDLYGIFTEWSWTGFFYWLMPK